MRKNQSGDASRVCFHCGFPIRLPAGKSCPKCDMPLQLRAEKGLLEVDIAHGGQTWETARQQLLQYVRWAVADGHSGLKVIHGRGNSSSGSASIKEMAMGYLKSLAREYGGRTAADQGNPGATILWLSRNS